MTDVLAGHAFRRIENIYLSYPICQTLSGKLSWSHYCELLSISDEKKRSFYKKETILELALKGNEINKASDVVKDPYVFEFLGLPEEKTIMESDLEKALITHIEKFLLELGKG